MKSVIALSLAAFVRAALAQTSAPIINTPASLTQCQPALLSFSGGQAPYFLAVLPAGQTAATPLLNLPNQAAAGTYTWVVNLAAGTNLSLRITDNTGATNYAAPLVIMSSSDSSCLSSSASSAAGSSTSRPASSSVVVGPATSVGSTVTSTIVSAAPSATVTASSGPVTANITQTNGTSVAGSRGYNFTCPQGLLSYGITTAVLQGVALNRATRYFGNWSSAVVGTPVNSTGTGVGARRSYTFNGNVTFSETLRLNETNATTGTLHQQWNFTNAGPVAITNSLTVFNAFDDLTVYTNTTTNATSVQYFILACFNDQTQGLPVIASFIQGAITTFAQQINATSARAARRAIMF
ncbi:hypothetical protein EMMF5_006257 [Cystobasidiomycetes sp. EMM_F5]